MKAHEIPQLLVLNQIDKIDIKSGYDRDEYGNISHIQLSAKTGNGIEFLKKAIVEFSQKHKNQRNGQYA
jgi:GTP-binding protein HflX